MSDTPAVCAGEPTSVRVEACGRVVDGVAVDCRDWNVTASEVAAAVERTAVVESASDDGVVVSCPQPGCVHEHVGVVRHGASVDVRGGVAAAARSRGVVVDGMDALRAARAALADATVPSVDVAAARERVADARAAASAVQADVAAARGMVQARADLDADVDASRERLRAAIATASERETEVLAAEQALARERERARTARDARERRLMLEDRVGRLERDVRARLADAGWSVFADAVESVPGGDDAVESVPGCDDAVVGGEPGTFVGDDVTAALAVVRVADVDAPVVLAAGRFGDADVAHRVLDAPVVLATP